MKRSPFTTPRQQTLGGRPVPRRLPLWRLLLLATLLLGLPAWPPPCHGAPPPRVEHAQLKAVFLYNFLHFVTWPIDPQGADKAAAMVIGVVGDSPVLQALEELAATITEKNKRSLRIVALGSYRPGLDLGACHILFVSASEEVHLAEIIADLNKRPVLTVGDTDPFLAAGGMITMLEQQSRIRYHINRKVASEAGLRLSSQLLKTAIDVQDK